MMADSNTSDGTADELPAAADEPTTPEPTTPDPTDTNDEQSQPEVSDEDDDDEEDEDEDEEDEKSGNEESKVEDEPPAQAENSITFRQGDSVPITKVATKKDAETALIYISSDIIKKVQINDQKTIVSAVE